ncbi:unnamed protein product [Lactuca virosa]|uniref:Malectin-like domain-containing protein n=1 Tax=Lactuca virosa TaxID=75947 RepID=A0AAU9M6R1_9ASTR|nr:unnamed protein product [Lactuca virosa]
MKVNLSTTMFTFPLPLFSFLLFSITTTTTTAAQPYKPTDYFLLNCGGATATTDRKWDPMNVLNSCPPPPPPSHLPQTTATLPSRKSRTPLHESSKTSFTYTFPVTNGPKFLRLYFYPATYSHHNADQSFFSVSSNGYSLLSNFIAFQTSSYLRTRITHSNKVPHFVKEFIIYVNHTETINITFTPSPESYAFINGIEIVSQPENLYYKSKNVKYVGQYSGPVISEDTCLENIYRLNVGGELISPILDTGMYRSWDQDDPYLFPVRTVTPVNKTPIVYKADTPNYTAPELVYATQRSMGAFSENRNLTWQLPVDSGFYYNLRLHFCNIIPQYRREFAVFFKIYITNQTAEDEADLFYWTQGTWSPVFKDYGVFVYDFDGSGRKRDLWLAMGPNYDLTEYPDAFLNGLEVFKLSMNGSLTDRDSELRPTVPPPPSSPVKNKTPSYAAIIGGIGGAVVLMLSTLGFIVFRRVKHSGDKSSGEQKSKDNRLPSEVLCSRPVIINRGVSDEEVNLAEWGRLNYGKGTLKEIVDKRICDEIAPNCLMKFGEVANSCLRMKGSKRPKMDEVVWGLEFALQLQEADEKRGGMVGEVTGGMSENQEYMFPMKRRGRECK